jgi:F0F1-type ATP synthase membrane subunit b/b'
MDRFNELLQEYKNQYLQFLASGDQSFKTAYKRAYSAIEEAIDSKQSVVDSEKKALQHFADSYKQTNKELSDTADDATNVISSAQEIHDEYETSKQRYDSWTKQYTPPPEIDVAKAYGILMRIGIFLILVPVLYFFGAPIVEEVTSYRYRYLPYLGSGSSVASTASTVTPWFGAR